MPPRLLWSAVLPRSMPSMKNNRRAVRGKTAAGKPFTRFIKSDAVLGWMEVAEKLIRSTNSGPPLSCDVTLCALIYYRSRRSDLSVETLMDVLQSSGVIENDRQIRRVIAEKFVDPANPRVVVGLAPVSEYLAATDAALMGAIADISAERPVRDRIGRAA